MARRRRHFGAVRHHGGGRAGSRVFNVMVDVQRDIGASTSHAYNAIACVTKKGRARRRGYFTERCGQGHGRGPTAAAKGALQSLGRNLK